ncbi:MAG: outer membrane lipoprotein-sorting protein [Myxococcota bacterium]
MLLCRRALPGCIVGLVLLSVPVAPAQEAGLEGRAVMERVDARPRGGDQTARVTWRLIDKKGRERVRETRSYWRDHRELPDGLRAKRLIVFDAPPEVRETGFLVWSHEDALKDDERWVYLPALRKVRRVAGRDRSKSFVGTDFSYDDLSDRGLDDDSHRLLREQELAGVRHYVVESVPREEGSPYARRVQYVDAERYTVTRIEYEDRSGRPKKVLDAHWQEVDGIFAWDRLEMRDGKSGHRTVVEVREVQHGTGLPDDIFSETTLRLGVP